MRVHAGRRVQTQLYGKCRQVQRFLVEVVERAQSEIARLRPVIDFARVGRERGADADLKVRPWSIQQLDGEQATVGGAPLDREARARLDRELAMGNGIRIFQAQRSTLVEILVIDGRR